MHPRSYWYKAIIVISTPLLLFAVLGVYRNHIIPHDADYNRSQWLLTGDEPAYLLAGQAIAVGDGLNLRNVNEHKTYKSFQERGIIGKTQWTWDYYRETGGMTPLLDRSEYWGNAQIKHHEPLLPLVIAPFSLSSQYRWLVASFQATLICLAALILMLRFWRTAIVDMGLIGIALLVFWGNLPIAYYSTQVYPETIAGVLLILALLLIPDSKNSISCLGIIILLLSLWATPRVIGGVFLVLLTLGTRAVFKRNWGHVIVIIIGVLVYFAYHLFIWGDFFPPAFDAANRATISFLPRGLLYSFLAPDIGILFLNPAVWVGFISGGIMLWFHHETIDWIWLLLFLGILFGASMLPLARAGTCPAGRYQTIPCYLLLFPLVRMIAFHKSAWKARLLSMLPVLGTAGFTIGLLVAQQPKYWYQYYHPLFGYPRIHAYYKYLPNADSDRFYVHVLGWFVVFLAFLCVYDLARIGLRALRVVMSKKTRSGSKKGR